jgi:hypothetical protein
MFDNSKKKETLVRHLAKNVHVEDYVVHGPRKLQDGEEDHDCEEIKCDFSGLTPGTILDWDELYISCNLIAYSNSSNSDAIGVFNSSNIKSKHPKNDPDLGSPNRRCKKPNKGPGIGSGGIKGAKFENCNPLGNLLILQNPSEPDPNDDPNGGCMYIDPIVLTQPGSFQYLVNDFGLLDIEEGASIRVRCIYHLEIIVIFLLVLL